MPPLRKPKPLPRKISEMLNFFDAMALPEAASCELYRVTPFLDVTMLRVLARVAPLVDVTTLLALAHDWRLLDDTLNYLMSYHKPELLKWLCDGCPRVRR